MTESDLSMTVDPLTTLQHMARSLHLKDPRVDAMLDAVASIAVSTIPVADLVSVNLVSSGLFAQRAATAEAARVLGEFERVHQSGPCTDAARDQVVVRVDDILSETRWPGFEELAAGCGVRSMLCVPLWVEDHQLGSLTAYAFRPGAFDENHERVAGIFAGYAALALADARRTESLKTALINRDVIGQAKGILMERRRITADQAFELLSKASQRLNRKLVEVADQLVNTGELA